MSKSLSELIGYAAADCPDVHISGDVYALGGFILAELNEAGLKVVAREPASKMVSSNADEYVPLYSLDAVENTRAAIWRAMWDAAP